MKAGPSFVRSRLVPAAAAAVVLAAIMGGAWYGYGHVLSQPIAKVTFSGDVKRIARKDLDAFAQSVRGLDASAASLAAMRDAARRIPWVRDASVRRHFPDAIEVSFEAHEALARWGDGALVSVRGEIFQGAYDGFLPRFRGADTAAVTMASEYPRIVKTLAPLASAVTELRLSARGAWQVALESGQTLELGRGEIHPRLERFAAAWPQLVAQGVETRHVDLRYPNGFALTLSPVLSQGGAKAK